MTVAEISYLAVAGAVVAWMVVGFAYYHPRVTGNRWMRAVGHDEQSVSGGAGTWVHGVVLAASFVMVLAMALVIGLLPPA